MADSKTNDSLLNGKDLSCNLMSYSEICGNIRQLMSEVIDLKNNSNKSDEKNSEIAELRMQGSFDFLSLKQLNRASQIQCKLVKDKTLESKQKLDGYNLQLENLQYEISHLHREITKCLEFRSRHDDISLIPVEEFYQLAPPEISNTEATKDEPHLQTLARLDFELQQRKELASNLQDSKNTREAVSATINEKKQNLQTLGPVLENLLKASLPLQEAFEIPLDHLRKQHDLARLLPRSLFVLFLQAQGYEEACDSLLSVSIDGDVDAARKMEEAAQNSENVMGVIQNGNDSESDQDDPDDQDSGRGHRRKKEKEVLMDHDGADSLKHVFVPHPLNVTLNLRAFKNGPTLQLKFWYFNTLNIVTVHGQLELTSESNVNDSSLLDSKNLLTCILDNDFGLKSPNPSTAFLLQKSLSNLNDMFSSYGRPYLWAQNLCGLVYMSSKNRKVGEDMKISFNHIQRTIKAIRKRITSRISLAQQIEQFAKKMVVYNGPSKLDMPNKIFSSLSSWSEISLSDYRKLPHAAAVIDLELLGSDEEASCHRYFIASIKRGSTLSVDAAVVVYCDYPLTLPLFSIAVQWRGLKTSSNDHNIQEMETELNVRLTDASKNNDVLTLQIMRLMIMIDLYVETECDADDATQPVEFNMSKLCPHKAKGPARLKPFLYEAATKTFVHRNFDS